MNDSVRLGVVGLGPRGRSMFMVARNVSNISQAAICESQPDRLAEAKELFPQARPFSDFDEMLSSGLIDAVMIETPANNHACFCVKALQAGINVLSDVPCVYTYDEADMLWQAEQESSVIFMFGSNPNFWGFVETAVDLNRKGFLGEPYFLEAEYMHDIRDLFESSPWRATFKPIIYSTHSLGPLLRLIDTDLRWVSCFDSGGHVNKQPDQHDVMTAIFRTENNVLVRVTCSFINNYRGGQHWYRIMGTKGCFERTSGRGKFDPSRVLHNTTDIYGMDAISEVPINNARPECKDVNDDHGGADYAMLDAFIKAVTNKKTSPISLRQGLRMSLPGLFAAKSADNGGKLTRITYPWEK